MKFLKAIKSKTRTDRAMNADVRNDLNLENMQDKISKMSFRQYVHIKRIKVEKIPARMEKMKINVKKTKGRTRAR